MAKTFASFYFTKIDPDYSVKGSRDPLALQVLWQHQGKKLIPYLSTVSSNIQDFQIFCLAHYFYEREADVNFPKFFMRFEQLMAYVRCDSEFSGIGFTGIEAARKRLTESSRISVSNTAEDNILSNQRAYGIWGKYARPFNDIGFVKKENFRDVFDSKINSIVEKEQIFKIVNKVLKNNQCIFNVTELAVCKQLLIITKKEVEFYTTNILMVNSSNPYQNILFDFVSKNKLPKEFNLYDFINAFSKSLSADNLILKNILKETIITEQLISPINQIFRYIQTKPIWNKSEILKDTYINQCKHAVNYLFTDDSEQNKIKNQFIQTLQKDNWNLMIDLIEKNKEVTDWRGGSPWMTIQKNIVEVHHADGGFVNPDYDPNSYYTNGYFIDTYLSLYRQINAPK